MTQREELDLILKFIRKYHLPLSPILEYAVNEKKAEYPDEETAANVVSDEKEDEIIESVIKPKAEGETATIELTREIIEAARTPNGGFTKSQLAAIGIQWPAPKDWIEQKIGTFITPKQYKLFNEIKYVVLTKKTKNLGSRKGNKK